jgi:hypothetical protein
MGKMNSKQASQIKNLGHAEETTFNALFGDKLHREINHSGASQDNTITNDDYKSEISLKLGRFNDYSVSLKSGKTWQFHLGQISELSDSKNIVINKSITGETHVKHNKNFDEQLEVLKNIEFWNKYLGKKSELLCYNDKQKCYTFFRMSSVTDFISKNVEWSILDTGRLKGKLLLRNKEYTILTFEYRVDKKQFVLGACGGQNGYRLFEVLKEYLNHCQVFFERKTTDSDFVFNLLKKKNITKKSKGEIGQIYFNDNFLFLCIEENVWKKIELKDL